MTRSYHLAILVVMVFLLTTFSGCTGEGPEVTEEFNEEYEVVEGTVLSLKTFNGEINIEGGNSNKVVLSAIKRTRFGENEFENVEIEVTQEDGVLNIETKHLRDWVSRVSVDLSVKVPNNVIIDSVDTSNGDIDITGIKGDVGVRSSNGEINISDVDGFVKASTDNGRIYIEETKGISDLDSSNGDIIANISDFKDNSKVSSSNGEITLYLNPSLNAEIYMRTSNGKISTGDVLLTITEYDKSSIRGVIGIGGDQITVETSNGNINLYMQ